MQTLRLWSEFFNGRYSNRRDAGLTGSGADSSCNVLLQNDLQEILLADRIIAAHTLQNDDLLNERNKAPINFKAAL